MGTFFDDASLVMIPSGVKESKLYSIKPSNGDGDFTFSRGTDTATRVNASGLIEKERSNQLLQSNTFSTTWSNSNSTETSGQSGYDGSSDAWLLTKTDAFGLLEQSVSGSEVSTFSVYIKAGSLNWAWITLRDSVGSNDSSVYLNLTDGSLGTSAGGAYISATTESVGGGWYRCSVVSSGGYNQVRIAPADGDGDLTGTSGNIYIQDAMLNQGLVAQPYIETTTAAVYEGITDNLPRLDYSGGASCPSLLLEPSRTNLIDNTEYLNGWSLQSGIVVSDNQTTSPEGVQNAGITTSSFSNSRIQKNLGTLGSNHIFSAFVKSDGVGTRVQLRSNVTGDNLILDVAASGEVTHFSDTAVGNNYGIENYGNGWYRVWFEGTTDGATSNYYQIYPDVQFGNRSVYVWGIQMEAGSYPTSYIPTMGTSASRSKDSAGTRSDMQDFLGVDEGTWFTHLKDMYFDTTGTSVGTFTLRETSSLQIEIMQDGNFNYRVDINNSTAVQDLDGEDKLAIAWSTSGLVIYVNGSSVYSTTDSQYASAYSTLYLPDATRAARVYLKQMLFFPTRLTNAELAALTA